MATRVTRRATGVEPISMRFQHFLSLGRAAKDMTERQGVLKKALMEHAMQHGEADEKGTQVFLLPEAVDDGSGKRFKGFSRQRRVSQSFNEDRAHALLEEKGIDRDAYISTQEYVDQDKVARLYAEDVLTDTEFNALLDENITWAFVPLKED